MARIAVALFAAAFIAGSPAEAALLRHPTQAAHSVEKGVTVWRGAKPAPELALEGAPAATPCAAKTVNIRYTTVWPNRRLRTQGFWSGDGLSSAEQLARRRSTQGFYADRVAAGM